MPTNALIALEITGFAFLFGAVVGSFLNVVIHRLPRGESLVSPPSHCPACDTPIKPWDNVPVFAWLWLRGRCRHCKAAISPRYPLIEALTGVIFAALVWRFGISPETLVWMLLSAALIAAAVIDIDHQIIPDEISLGGLVVGAIVMPLLLIGSGVPVAAAFVHVLGGAALGAGVLWSVGFFHARLSVGLGRSFEHWPGDGEDLPRPSSVDYWTWFPGLGFGDVKLLAMIGAFLGPYGVLVTIFASALAGLALGVGWGLATRTFASPFGFAPAIALGALVALLLPFPRLLGL